jgi:hypothetical protein
MTNFDRWQLFMKDMCSPQSFVDFGFYYMISAALQRRVWLGDEKDPIYPNMYIILVGEPGIGKGRVIKPVNSILKHHKLNPTGVEEDKDSATVMVDVNAMLGNAMNKAIEQPLLIPVAPEATTYEALVNNMAKAVRRINYKWRNPATDREETKVYSHSSLCFCLEEMSSLFRKRTEDLVNFLLVTYDCGDYDYVTKHQGKDHVRKCCLNMLAGTTPSFLQATFDDKLLSEGFSSRSIFVYEYANRHNKWGLAEFTPEQIKAREEIIAHIKRLAGLYGQAKLSPEADEFGRAWWEEIHPTKRSNNNLKLAPYYARKKLHFMKLAMAIHFGESTDMVIGVESCKYALEVLDQAEKRMHFALSFGGKNHQSGVAKSIIKYLKAVGPNNPQSFSDLLIEFFDHATESELEEVIQFLSRTGQVERVNTVEGNFNRVGYCIKAPKI